MRSYTTGEGNALSAAVKAVFLRVDVENDAGAFIDLTSYSGFDWVVGADISESVDQIVPSATVYLRRDQDDGTTLSPLGNTLLDTGRDVRVYAAVMAQGSTPSSGDWQLLHDGVIDSIDFGSPEIQLYSRNKIGAQLADRWVEQTRQYGSDEGEDIEQVIAELLGDWTDGIALNTPSSPGFAVKTYEQERMPVLEAVTTLAALIGYELRPRWNDSTSQFELTFSEPNRAATSGDVVWTFGPSDYEDVTRFELSREDVRNVISVRYTDGIGERQEVEVTDATSVARFGRRWAQFDLADDSPIDTNTEATALANAALSDLSSPPAEQSVSVHTFWPLEIGDYLAFSANNVHYGTTQYFATVGYRHTFRANQHRTEIIVRGQPAAYFRRWEGTGQPTEDEQDTEQRLSIVDFREIDRSTSGVTWTWRTGILVDTVWVYSKLVAQPVTADEWFGDSDEPVAQLKVGVDTQEYVAAVPPPGYLRYLQFEPRGPQSSGYVSGPIKRVVLHPLAEEPDQITALIVQGNHEDGSVAVTVGMGDLGESYRYAYSVGTGPTQPSDAAVEAGTVRTISNADSFSLAAGTVGLGETIYFRAAGYLNNDGTGEDGATDHGPFVEAKWERIKFRAPSMEVTDEDDSTNPATFEITVNDPDGRATELYYRTKTGANNWSAWTLKSSGPTDGTAYSETVTMQEGHQSFVQFRLDYNLGGENGDVHITSSGLDFGRYPDGDIALRINYQAGTLSAEAFGDSDTAQIKIAAAKTSPPSDATVNAQPAKNPSSGRSFTTSDIGTLLTGLAAGDVLFAKALFLGPNGEVATSYVTKSVIVPEEGEVTPVLEITADGLQGVNPPQSNTLLFTVTVDDPASLADDLYYRTRQGDGSWSSWVLKSAAPSDGTAYSETVSLLDSLTAQIQFRLDYTYLGEAQSIYATSSAQQGLAPTVEPPSIAFDANGQVTIGVNASETAHTQYYMVVDESDAGYSVRQTFGNDTTVSSTSSGTSLYLSSTSNYKAGDWVIINRGGTWEIARLTSIGTPCGLASSLGSVWGAGVSVELLGNAALTARSGSITMDGGGGTDFQAINVDLGDNVKVTGAAITDPSGYKAISSNAAGPFVKTRGDTKNAVPRVRVQATRSGTTATVTLTISDPALSVSTVSYKKREGNGSLDATWQTSWDTATGTIGTSADLTRSEALTVSDGLDSEFLWRVEYTDENGDTKEIGGSVPVSNLEEITKTQRITAHAFVPGSGGDNTTPDTDWTFNVNYMQSTTNNQGFYYASLTMPPGVTITGSKMRTYNNYSGDVIAYQIYRTNDSGGAATLLTNMSITGTGYKTTTDSCNELVGASNQYSIVGQMQGTNAASTCRLFWVEIDYTMPSYDKTL